MATFQDLLDAANQKTQQQQVLAQPSLMDSATNDDGSDVDPQGTAAIQQAQRNQDAMNTGAGQAMGTIGGPSFTKSIAEQAAADTAGAAAPQAANAIGNTPQVAPSDPNSLMAAIQKAKAASNVQVIPSALDNQMSQYANAAANQPSYFDAARAKATQLGVGATPQEQMAMRNQALATQERIAARNAQQLAARRDPGFQQLLQKMKGNK